MSEFKIEYGPPSAEAMELAETELRETPQLVKESIEKLRQLINEETNLYFKTTDEILTIFLRPCKWYPESALQLMKNIADFKDKYADVLKDMTAESFRSALTENCLAHISPYRDQKGRRILIVKSGADWDPKKLSANDLFRLIYILPIIACKEPETQIRGSVILVDYKDLGMKQIKQCTPAYVYMFITYSQDATPLRQKEMHIVNQPFLYNILWNLCKRFLNPKFRSRIHFHGTNMESLHQYLDAELLPAEYGGKKPKIDYNQQTLFNTLLQVEDWVKEWHTFGWKK